MPKLNQQGVIHLLLPLILIAGIIGGVYLITNGNPLKLFSRASVSVPLNPITSFTLSPNSNDIKVGDTVGVKILVRSDITEANLFTAKIKYPKDFLQVVKVDYPNSFIKNWAERNHDQYLDNTYGEISLVGGVPNPGFKTTFGQAPASMAVIYFKALKTGSASISFSDDSAIYSNADNLNILTQKQPIHPTITSRSVSGPIDHPIVSPTPAPSAGPGLGDGNKDGKINLVDLSVLLADFNKNNGIRTGIDMNGDGVINSFDFSLLKNVLIANKVIKG